MFKSQLCKIIICLLLLQIPLLGIASAEVKEIIAEGTYLMGDGETPTIAQERAVVDAKRIAVEQAGTYLESYSEIQNMQLKKDVVRAFAAAIIKTTVIDKKTVAENGSVKYWVKLRCLVDAANIETLKAGMDYNKFAEDYARSQEEIKKNRQEIEELKRQLASAKDVQEKNVVKEKIHKNEQTFTANQWFDKAHEYTFGKGDFTKDDIENAIIALSEAIKINPHYSIAYMNRGSFYSMTDKPDLAIADHSKYIELNPQHALGYYNRGGCYVSKEQYDLAIADFNKAIEIVPNFAYIYFLRGNCYFYKKQFDLAIADYSKAIQLNLQSNIVYANRGSCYAIKEQYDLAIADYNKAIELAPNLADMYVARGKIFNNKGQHDLAINDFNKASEIEPKLSEAYYNRAISYQTKNQHESVIILNSRFFSDHTQVTLGVQHSLILRLLSPA